MKVTEPETYRLRTKTDYGMLYTSKLAPSVGSAPCFGWYFQSKRDRASSWVATNTWFYWWILRCFTAFNPNVLNYNQMRGLFDFRYLAGTVGGVRLKLGFKRVRLLLPQLDDTERVVKVLSISIYHNMNRNTKRVNRMLELLFSTGWPLQPFMDEMGQRFSALHCRLLFILSRRFFRSSRLAAGEAERVRACVGECTLCSCW